MVVHVNHDGHVVVGRSLSGEVLLALGEKENLRVHELVVLHHTNSNTTAIVAAM